MRSSTSTHAGVGHGEDTFISAGDAEQDSECLRALHNNELHSILKGVCNTVKWTVFQHIEMLFKEDGTFEMDKEAMENSGVFKMLKEAAASYSDDANTESMKLEKTVLQLEQNVLDLRRIPSQETVPVEISNVALESSSKGREAAASQAPGTISGEVSVTNWQHTSEEDQNATEPHQKNKENEALLPNTDSTHTSQAAGLAVDNNRKSTISIASLGESESSSVKRQLAAFLDDDWLDTKFSLCEPFEPFGSSVVEFERTPKAAVNESQAVHKPPSLKAHSVMQTPTLNEALEPIGSTPDTTETTLTSPENEVRNSVCSRKGEDSGCLSPFINLVGGEDVDLENQEDLCIPNLENDASMLPLSCQRGSKLAVVIVNADRERSGSNESAVESVKVDAVEDVEKAEADGIGDLKLERCGDCEQLSGLPKVPQLDKSACLKSVCVEEAMPIAMDNQEADSLEDDASKWVKVDESVSADLSKAEGFDSVDKGHKLEETCNEQCSNYRRPLRTHKPPQRLQYTPPRKKAAQLASRKTNELKKQNLLKDFESKRFVSFSSPAVRRVGQSLAERIGQRRRSGERKRLMIAVASESGVGKRLKGETMGNRKLVRTMSRVEATSSSVLDLKDDTHESSSTSHGTPADPQLKRGDHRPSGSTLVIPYGIHKRVSFSDNLLTSMGYASSTNITELDVWKWVTTHCYGNKVPKDTVGRWHILKGTPLAAIFGDNVKVPPSCEKMMAMLKSVGHLTTTRSDTTTSS